MKLNWYNTDYKSKCAFGSFQSQRRFDLVLAFSIVHFKTKLKSTIKTRHQKLIVLILQHKFLTDQASVRLQYARVNSVR